MLDNTKFVASFEDSGASARVGYLKRKASLAIHDAEEAENAGLHNASESYDREASSLVKDALAITDEFHID